LISEQIQVSFRFEFENNFFLIIIKWSCRAELVNNIEFGKVIVSCEGYDYTQDEYILEGSCSVN
jgi:hypothetical protein